MNAINSTLNGARPAPLQPLTASAEPTKGTSFKDFLLKSIADVNAAQQDANAAVETLMTGGDVDPASVLTAVEKADLAFRMMMQMRNKVMQTYQEIKDIRI
jgi:flagellar hook-basal body complex protein FliE